MKEQFIPYELASEFKELGFKDNCIAYYYNLSNGDLELILHEHCNDSINTNYPKEISGILWQQAFDWFKKRGYYFEIYPDNQQFILEAKEWYYIIKKGVACTNDIKYYSYEEARLACLVKLIKLIKNK